MQNCCCYFRNAISATTLFPYVSLLVALSSQRRAGNRQCRLSTSTLTMATLTAEGVLERIVTALVKKAALQRTATRAFRQRSAEKPRNAQSILKREERLLCCILCESIQCSSSEQHNGDISGAAAMVPTNPLLDG